LCAGVALRVRSVASGHSLAVGRNPSGDGRPDVDGSPTKQFQPPAPASAAEPVAGSCTNNEYEL
jgi:hypothetical protein